MLVAPTTLAAAATQGSWDPTLVVVSVAQMILVAVATLALLAQVAAVRIRPDAHSHHRLHAMSVAACVQLVCCVQHTLHLP